MTGKRKLFEGHDFSDIDTLALLNRGRKNISETGAPLVPMNIIIEDPDQPRTEFDDDGLNEMAESIRERGVLQPILIKAANPDGFHVIIAGARRFRASKLAGKDMIPALVRHAAADSYDQMIENIQREALSHRDIARFIRDQLATGAKKSAIGKSLGKPPAWVSLYVDFFDMDPAIQDGMSDYGTRAAHELHAAMQIDAERTRAFINSGEPVTQRSAVAFRQSLKTAEETPVRSPEVKVPAAPVAAAPAGHSAETHNDVESGSPDPSRREPEPVSFPYVEETRPTAPEEPWRIPPITEEDEAETSQNRDSWMPDADTEPVYTPALRTGRKKEVPPSLLVRVGERVGQLLLKRRAGQGTSFGVVRFDDGTEDETALSDMLLMEFVQDDAEEESDA